MAGKQLLLPISYRWKALRQEAKELPIFIYRLSHSALADPAYPSDTANFAPSGPSPMDSPVRKLPSVKHAPVTVAILP